MNTFDVAIVGGGVAGCSLAFRLAPHQRVLLVESERQFGVHSSGRSATLFTEFYGNELVHALTVHSRAFFENPPEGFSEYPLLRQHGALWIAAESSSVSLLSELEHARKLVPSLRQVDYKEARALCPILQPSAVAQGVYEPLSADLDATAMLSGYMRTARAAGAVLLSGQEHLKVAPRPDGWSLDTSEGTLHARILVNAAGAWCDQFAMALGSRGIGARACRRTLAIIDAPPGIDVGEWPTVSDVDNLYYFKPEGASRLIISPADETAVTPQDVLPEDIDVAIAVDRVSQATTLEIGRVYRSWAGLRTFAPGRAPVIGWDPDVPNLFWTAAHGGFGLMASPAMSAVAAALLLDQDLSPALVRAGVSEQRLSPAAISRSDPTP